MCRILLVEDAVPAPEALRVLIEQHPCAGAIQLESCAFSQVRERVSQGPRIDALFAPVDAPAPSRRVPPMNAPASRWCASCKIAASFR